MRPVSHNTTSKNWKVKQSQNESDFPLSRGLMKVRDQEFDGVISSSQAEIPDIKFSTRFKEPKTLPDHLDSKTRIKIKKSPERNSYFKISA